MTWDSSTSTNISGYSVYYGVAPGAYTGRILVGNTNSATMSGLAQGKVYYFAATAQDASGVESSFSNEISYSVPSAPNQAPTLNPLADVTLHTEAGPQTVLLSGISSGSPAENQPLTVTASSSNPTLIPDPSVTYTSPNGNGSLALAAALNVSGTATITVMVNDGQSTNNLCSRSFLVTVIAPNQPPTLDPINNITLTMNAGAQVVSLSGITAGGAAENQRLSVSASSSNPALIPGPSVNYTSPNIAGSLSFTPRTDGIGSVVITVTVDDGQALNHSVTRSFTVTINGPNQAPTLDQPDDLNLNENDGPKTINLTGITAGTTNEFQTLTITTISSNPDLIPAPAVSYTNPDTTATLTVTPRTNSFGTATITVNVNDGQNVNSTYRCAFLVTVNQVNQPPTLDPISDCKLKVNPELQHVTLTGISSGCTNEQQTVSISAVSSNPSLIPYPTIKYTAPDTTAVLSFGSTFNGSGTTTITVTVNDGQATNNTINRAFTVTIGTPNQPPTLDPLPNLTITENAGPQTVNLSGITPGGSNEIQTLLVTAISSNPALIPDPGVSYGSPNSTGFLTFKPVAGAVGTATISVTVNDGQNLNGRVTRTFMVTVSENNLPPTLDLLNNLTLKENDGPQTVTLSGISSGSANEVQSLSITAVSSNPQLIPGPTVNYSSPNSTGSLSFTPVNDAVGTARITVTVSDGQNLNDTISRDFLVVVKAVNAAPTLDPISNITVTAPTTQTVPLTGISSGATEENQNLKVTAQSSDPSVTGEIAVQYLSPNTTGSLTFTPSKTTFSSVTITVTIDDGASANNITTRSFGVLGGIGQLSIGSAVVPPGQSTNVALDLATSLDLSELDLVLALEPNHLTNLNLQALSEEVAADFAWIVPRDSGTWHLHLAAKPGKALGHLGAIAQLGFDTIEGVRSAFVPLTVLEVSGRATDGKNVNSLVGKNGRIVVLGKEPLLEAGYSSTGVRTVTVYADSSLSYALEYSTNPFDPTSWRRLPSLVATTNSLTPVQDLGPGGDQVFYRAVATSTGM